MARLTCKQITKAFYEKHPELKKYEFWLIQGEGYFYLTSDKDDFYRDFTSTSIYVCRLHHMPLNRWIESIESLCEEAEVLTTKKGN